MIPINVHNLFKWNNQNLKSKCVHRYVYERTSNGNCAFADFVQLDTGILWANNKRTNINIKMRYDVRYHFRYT